MKRIFRSIQLTLLILLLPLFQGIAIAQGTESGSKYQFSVDPPWLYEPLIWIVGLALVGFIVLVAVKGQEQKMG
jgi:autotransporter translocation and assembly factor TamB